MNWLTFGTCVLSLVTTINACKARDDATSESSSRAAEGLRYSMEHLYDREKILCVLDEKGNEVEDSRRDAVYKAYLSWLNILVEVDPTVPTALRFGCPLEGAFLTVVYKNPDYLPQLCGKKAVACYHKQTNSIYLPNSDVTNVLHHEVGHSFGAGDTNLEDAPVDQTGQPPSSMSGKTDLITLDDELSVLNVFANHYSKRIKIKTARVFDRIQLLRRIAAKTGGQHEHPCSYAQQKELYAALWMLKRDDLDAFVESSKDISQHLFVLNMMPADQKTSLPHLYFANDDYLILTGVFSPSQSKLAEATTQEYLVTRAHQNIKDLEGKIECRVTARKSIAEAIRNSAKVMRNRNRLNYSFYKEANDYFGRGVTFSAGKGNLLDDVKNNADISPIMLWELFAGYYSDIGFDIFKHDPSFFVDAGFLAGLALQDNHLPLLIYQSNFFYGLAVGLARSGNLAQQFSGDWKTSEGTRLTIDRAYGSSFVQIKIANSVTGSLANLECIPRRTASPFEFIDHSLRFYLDCKIGMDPYVRAPELYLKLSRLFDSSALNEVSVYLSEELPDFPLRTIGTSLFNR